jgi:hypothetical protein
LRRLLMVSVVAALMAAMMVTAGPAKANVDVDVEVAVGGGSSFFDDVGDGIGFVDVGDSFFGFDLDDDNDFDGDDNDITNAFFVSQVDSVAGDIEPEDFFFG